MPAKGITDDEVIAAFEQGGSNRKAAELLGIDVRWLRRRKAKLAAKGWAPEHDMTHPVPDGYKVSGVSTLYSGNGTVSAQWVKSSEDKAKREALMQEAFDAMTSKLPRLKRTVSPKGTLADLLNCYVITDYHLGALAWAEETRGDDWDIRIAETLLVNWFAEAIKQAPDAETGVLAQLGDFLHTDGLEAITPAHHNILDADTRFQKIVRVAIRALRQVIAMLLAKHKRVRVICAEGNHDPAGSIWLREWLAAMYEREPRLTVDSSPDPYYCVEHGQTALFFHHGHKRKPTNIDTVFAAKFREVFGRTKHAYAHMGHLHHDRLVESNLMIVEQHRTLAAPDAFATRGGWLSGRDAKVITYSKRYGEVGRVVVSPQMVAEAA